MSRRRKRFPLSASLAGAAVVVAVLLGLGALPARQSVRGQRSGENRRPGAAGDHGRAERLLSRLPPSPGRPERCLRHQEPGRAGLVRLQDAQARSRPHAGGRSSAMLASRGRVVQVVLGRERDLRRRATDRSSRISPRARTCRAIESNDRLELARAQAIAARTSTIRSPLTVEPGVTRCTRPAVWALGFTGQGIVIAKPGHRHALDAQRAQDALPGLERLDAPTTTTTGTTRSTAAAASCSAEPPGALRRQRPRHAHDRHGGRGRRRRQPDRRRSRREMDRLPEHGPGQRHARRRTRSASSSSSRRPT